MADYSVYHTNVDGGGHVGDYATLAQAKAEAKRRSDRNTANGDRWGHRYAVYAHGRRVAVYAAGQPMQAYGGQARRDPAKAMREFNRPPKFHENGPGPKLPYEYHTVFLLGAKDKLGPVVPEAKMADYVMGLEEAGFTTQVELRQGYGVIRAKAAYAGQSRTKDRAARRRGER